MLISPAFADPDPISIAQLPPTAHRALPSGYAPPSPDWLEWDGWSSVWAGLDEAVPGRVWENNPGRQLDLLLRDTGREAPTVVLHGLSLGKERVQTCCKGFHGCAFGGAGEEKHRCCSSPAAFYSRPSGGVGIKVLGHWTEMKKDASHHKLRWTHTPVNTSSLMYDGDIRSKIQSDLHLTFIK